MKNDNIKKAIALLYDKDVNSAPVVISKGENILAEHIIDIAHKYNIPVVEDKETAKALTHLNLGDEIPYSLYEAVGIILAYVYKLKRDL